MSHDSDNSKENAGGYHFANVNAKGKGSKVAAMSTISGSTSKTDAAPNTGNDNSRNKGIIGSGSGNAVNSGDNSGNTSGNQTYHNEKIDTLTENANIGEGQNNQGSNYSSGTDESHETAEAPGMPNLMIFLAILCLSSAIYLIARR